MKIGLLLIATGKYSIFVDQLVTSANRWFLSGHDVTYFLFTDSNMQFVSPKISKIAHEHKPWPLPTLLRYATFCRHAEQLIAMDYLYYCDVDMRFIDSVGDEILGARVATQHPGYYNRRGTPEIRPQSKAFVAPHENMQYFAGGFNGGTSSEYIKMARTISSNIEHDTANGIVAVWHDESHMNRYFIDNPPTKILDPGYCYGESMNIPFKKRLLALNKNHAEIRN